MSMNLMSLPMRIDKTILQKIKILADKENRSNSNWCATQLTTIINNHEKQNGVIKVK